MTVTPDPDNLPIDPYEPEYRDTGDADLPAPADPYAPDDDDTGPDNGDDADTTTG